MYAVEFNASIHNGIIHIPTQYQELYEQQVAKIFVMVDGQQANNVVNQTTATDSIEKNGNDLVDFFQKSPLVSNIEITRSSEIYTNREVF